MTHYPALRAALGLLMFKGADIPADTWAQLEALGLKSQFTYQNSLYNAAGRYARAVADGSYSYPIQEFVRDFAGAIERELTSAWLEGMAANDLTVADMTPEWEAQMVTIFENERAALPDFVAWLVEVVETVKPLDAAWPQIHARLDLWVARYLDVVNQARMATADNRERFMWVYGDTAHCDTCAALNGIVAWKEEWEDVGLHPQQPPNDLLECGGWRCQCRLEPTTQRRSPGAADRLMNIVMGSGE